MYSSTDRREHRRIEYMWPLWFGAQEAGALHQGQAIDIGPKGIRFSVPDEVCPKVGDSLFVSFSYPLEAEVFDIGSYRNWCQVIRVDGSCHGKAHVVVQLDPAITLEQQTPMPVYA